MRLSFVSLLCALEALVVSAESLTKPKFDRFPYGAIKPTGWALDQGKVQAQSLPGQLRDWYSFVANSIWVPGGTEEYSEMHEAAPYWFNAMVSLPYQINDARLKKQIEDFVDHLISTQQEDGWIGPEPPAPGRLPWPRYLILLGLVQYVEVNPTDAPRVITAMHKFADLVYEIWSNDEQGHPEDGFQYYYQYVRWEELVYVLQWLYDNAPQGKEDQLIETMKLVKAAGFDWQNDWFTDAIFPKEAVSLETASMTSHGVNLGEALKSEALSYRWTNDAAAIANTWERIRLVYTYHGRASGTFGADEHLSGLSPSRGTETCAVVEQMFSLETIFGAFGNGTVLDKTEKIAYNAFPAASLADMSGHQYDQQPNQIWSKNMTDGATPYGFNGGYSSVFGMESNYPCCTVNHPQALPKFWAHSFFKADNGSTIIHALLGPTKLEYQDLSVDVATLYPFGSTLKYTVKTSKAITFKFHVPQFATTGKSTVKVNGKKAQSIGATAVDEDGLYTVTLKAGISTLDVSLDMPIQVELRANQAVAVHRGPLMYAAQVSFNKTTTPGWRNPQANNDAKRLFPDTDPVWFQEFDNHTIDSTLLPTSPWQLAIDPSTLAVHEKKVTSLPHLAWAPGNQPVTLSAKGCVIEWGIVKQAAADPPIANCTGEVIDVTLTAFGATPIRIGEIPTVKLG
ncbi:hypothetical protein DL96DRAFT_1613265 [Flagelloscypha sp. PMI_526]|nr:hypothetical protein DL96DRAFT_1613265 [Flagelloscypha sp. PMI_526]